MQTGYCEKEGKLKAEEQEEDIFPSTSRDDANTGKASVSTNCRQRLSCIYFSPICFLLDFRKKKSLCPVTTLVFLFQAKNKLVLLLPDSGLENYHLRAHGLPHNDGKRTIPSLAQLAGAALLCAARQAAPFSTAKPAIQKLVNELPLTREKKNNQRSEMPS